MEELKPLLPSFEAKHQMSDSSKLSPYLNSERIQRLVKTMYSNGAPDPFIEQRFVSSLLKVSGVFFIGLSITSCLFSGKASLLSTALICGASAGMGFLMIMFACIKDDAIYREEIYRLQRYIRQNQ